MMCLHSACRWWRQQHAATWTVGGTLRLSLLVALTFAGGVAAVGVIHQTAWSFRDGIYQHSRGYIILHQMQAILRSVESGELTLTAVEGAFYNHFSKDECFLGRREDGTLLIMVRERGRAPTWVGESRSLAEGPVPVYPMSGTIADNMRWLNEALIPPVR
jgi:hypothetical protein